MGLAKTQRDSKCADGIAYSWFVATMEPKYIFVSLQVNMSREHRCLTSSQRHAVRLTRSKSACGDPPPYPGCTVRVCHNEEVVRWRLPEGISCQAYETAPGPFLPVKP
jgi:hypothetical protein